MTPERPRAARLRERWREYASPEFVEVVPLDELEGDEASGHVSRRLRLLGPDDPAPDSAP